MKEQGYSPGIVWASLAILGVGLVGCGAATGLPGDWQPIGTSSVADPAVLPAPVNSGSEIVEPPTSSVGQPCPSGLPPVGDAGVGFAYACEAMVVSRVPSTTMGNVCELPTGGYISIGFTWQPDGGPAPSGCTVGSRCFTCLQLPGEAPTCVGTCQVR